jgi:DNA-binding Xre family transcriptional regulator
MEKGLKIVLEKFHCGERFKELCIAKKKDSPTEWAKILNLAHRNMVHYRWKSQHITANELYIICDELRITIDEFFKIKKEDLNTTVESSVKNTSKQFIEEQIQDLLTRVISLENALKTVENLRLH